MKLMARILLFVPEITQPVPGTHTAVSKMPARKKGIGTETRKEREMHTV
jgi:hypothetical protein